MKGMRDGKIKAEQPALKGLIGFANGIALICGIMLATSLTFAQPPDRGFQTANSYAATGLEVVNTTNGNLMLNIPVASLPAGRGGLGYTVNLQYNSKLWDSHQFTRDNGDPGENSNSYYSGAALGISPRGGWRLGTAYSLQIIDRLNFETPDVCHLNDPVSHLEFRWKVEMEMPDGTVRKFFPAMSQGNNMLMSDDGYANIDHNGVSYSAVQSQHPGSGICVVYQYTSPSNQSGMNYITMDGSRMRLFVPYQSSNWKLYMPNGTMVENYPPANPAAAQRITDRNGNYVEYIENKIIDQLGRYIEFVADPTNGDHIIRVKGVGGAAVETRLKWSSRWVRRTYMMTTASNAPYDLRQATLTENIPVLEKITFPTQLGAQSMDFEYYGDVTQPGGEDYTDGWGELKSVTLPTAAKSTYQYSDDGDGTAASILDRHATRKDLEYTEQYDNQTPVARTDTWLYGVSRDANGVTSPSGASSGDQTFYNQYASPWDTGLAYKSINPDGSFVERIWKYNLPFTFTGAASNIKGIGSANAYVKTEFTTIPNAAGQPWLTAIKDYKYDKNGNVLEIKEYDWVAYSSIPRNNVTVTGLPTGGLVLKRKTVNTYYNQAAAAENQTADSNSYSDPLSKKLKNVIKSTEIQDANGTPVSRTEFFYDDHDNKGNLIKTKSWDSTKGAYSNPLIDSNSISTTVEYNIYGSPILVKDAKEIQTQFTYGDITTPTGTVNGLYPTQTKTAYGTSIQRTSTAEYDFYTGLVKKTTDVDNDVSTETEYDALGRPLKVKTAVGTPLEIWTQTEYNDPLRRVIVRSDIETKGDGKKVAIQHYDQLGRIRLTRMIEDIATEDPTNEQHGIKVQTRYRYDDPTPNNPDDIENNNGVYSLTSNPYRAATSAQATNEESMGWTLGYAVKNGRRSETKTFSGISLPAPWGNNTNSTGVVTTDIDADRTLITDQAGKKRISKTNALGQLVNLWEVKEPDADTETITFGNPAVSLNGLKTSYSYNTLNNLATVNQGSQQRTFFYSSLSRLLSAQNPESGTTGYQYDANGNLTQKTDARNVVTLYTYDALNRILTRSYSAPANTPNYENSLPVTYTYDNLPNAKGKLTRIVTGTGSTPFSVTEYQSFDKLGRVTQSRQVTDGMAYGAMTYIYSLSGALVEQTYPDGSVVKNILDNNGELSMVQSKKSAQAGFWNYASHFTFTAAGAVSSMQLGNGRWESTRFNSRLQPVQIALGSTENATDRLKLDYSYGELQSGGTIDASKNNGNIAKQIITVPTETRNNITYNGFAAAQTYTYDSLNRIKDAKETIGTTEHWKQTFLYDRYGNRRFETANNQTTTIEANCPAAVCNPEADATNNRLVGYVFDNAGNTTRNAQNRKFTYDGENKQVKVETLDASGNVINTLGQYFYDGDGKRVKKYVPATEEITIFLYDASGRLIMEYSTVQPQTPQVSYLTTDQLGSPRINTNADGTVMARHDYQPFGEEINRASYGSDEVRKQFTSYERDTETDLDFAQARMYSKNYGRFTTVDPIFIKADRLIDPQRINLYSYVRNQPLLYTDPTGEDLTIKITNIVVGTQKMRRKDDKTGKLTKVTYVKSYRVVVTNESGSRRTFEVTRDSSVGERGDYRRDGEPPPGVFRGRVREDSDAFNKGFRIELTSPGRNPGEVNSPDEKNPRTAIQIHRNFNDEGSSLGCYLFPQGDRERLKQTVNGLLEQDRKNGFGDGINVYVQPRNAREGDGAGDVKDGDPTIRHEDKQWDKDEFSPGRIHPPRGVPGSVPPGRTQY